MGPKKLIFVSLLLLTLSCKERVSVDSEQLTSYNNEFAKHFRVAYDSTNNQKVVEIKSRWSGESSVERYRLVSDSADIVESSKSVTRGETVIKIPPKKIISMSTTYLPYLSLLGEIDKVCAISGAKYVSDSTIKSRVATGEVVDIGFESSLNIELVLSLQPDLILTYGVAGENNRYISNLIATGISVITIDDYIEQHPLGKMEYIKLFGALFGKDEMAENIYSSIRENYYREKEAAKVSRKRPKVLLNAPWKGVWHLPTNQSYMAHLIKDAGGELLFDIEEGVRSHNVSIEEVLLRGDEVDFWLQPNQYESLEQLQQSEPLFEKFPLITLGRVYNNNKRKGGSGGSDFWERGVVEPDIILKDLIEILHSNGEIKEGLVYYKPLK